MAYTVNLSQIGSKGTTLFETSFGLEFTADALITPKIKTVNGRPRRVGTKRERVIRPLSPCCGAAYTRPNERGTLACHKCRTLSPWPEAMLDFELARDFGTAVSEFEPLIDPFIPELLENSLIAAGLVNAVEEVFSNIRAGKRTREVIALVPEAEV